MNTRKYQYRCSCDCHKGIKLHPQPVCDCGKPVTPPRSGCTPPQKPPACTPPEICPQPGTVDVPQDQAPTTPPYRPRPKPGEGGRPPAGDPGEIPWFKEQVTNILRNGPSFGKRKDEFLPYLAIRARSSDTGNRPLSGVFWESPDIGVLPEVESEAAPLMPQSMGGTAVAGAPNTIYAHVWNLGKAPVFRARVEFYWFNPSLGISRADAHLIGATWVDLADRFTVYPDWREENQPYGTYMSRGCHAIVRCPETWVPQMVNHGHECLVVRVFEPIMDPVSPDQFSSAKDRHVGQHNLAVVEAHSPATIDLPLDLGRAEYPGESEVEVEIGGPETMEFLQLLTDDRTPDYVSGSGKIVYGLMPPSTPGGRVPPVSQMSIQDGETLLRFHERFKRGCEPLSVTFHANAPDLKKKQAQVLRVRQKVAGEIVGGYTVLMLHKG